MEHILVVEDEQNIRETLVDILELAGYAVSTATNGREGYDAIIAEEPALVLCDVSMPQMTGFELLKAINEKMRGEITPAFLFLTAKVEKQDIRQGMNLGADDYILKPFDHNEMLDVIRMRLDKRAKNLRLTEGGLSQSVGGIEKLALPSEDGLELVSFDQIIKCQAERAYCTFYLSNGQTSMVSKPMKEFESTLLQKGFFKIHKSTIVNLAHVQKYVRGKGGYLVMTDGTTADVSTRRKEALMQVLKME